MPEPTLLDRLAEAGAPEATLGPDERMAARLSPARQAEFRALRSQGIYPRSGNSSRSLALALERLDAMLAFHEGSDDELIRAPQPPVSGVS